MDLHNQRPSIGIDHELSLAAQHLHASIIATWTAGFRSLDALTLPPPSRRTRTKRELSLSTHSQMSKERE